MLIGSSGQRSTFTKEVLETLTSFNEVELNLYAFHILLMIHYLEIEMLI